MALPLNNTNPDLVDVADQGYDGLPSQVPPIGSTPASISPTNADGGGSSVDGPISSSIATSGGPTDGNQTIDVAPTQVHRLNLDGGGSSVDGPISSSVATSGGPTDANQTVDITPPQTAQTNVNGGTFSPQSPNTSNTTQNNIAGQTYGTGTPRNVFV